MLVQPQAQLLKPAVAALPSCAEEHTVTRSVSRLGPRVFSHVLCAVSSVWFRPLTYLGAISRHEVCEMTQPKCEGYDQARENQPQGKGRHGSGMACYQMGEAANLLNGKPRAALRAGRAAAALTEPTPWTSSSSCSSAVAVAARLLLERPAHTKREMQRVSGVLVDWPTTTDHQLSPLSLTPRKQSTWTQTSHTVHRGEVEQTSCEVDTVHRGGGHTRV